MRAAVLTAPDGPGALVLKEVPTPAPAPSEILVRVKASALNRADLLQTLGLYPVPADAPQDIPGLEYAGVVEAVGAKAKRWKVGDKVMGLVGGGAFAEYLVCHEREALTLPSDLSFTDAAALPEAFLTAWDALVLQAGLQGGEQVLIHAAGSGVGSAAVQLVALLGATAIGSSRTAEKLERLKSLGLSHGVDTSAHPKFSTEVLKVTGGRGVDVVLDLVSGDTLPETVKCCALSARVMLVGMLGGRDAELELATVLRKRLRLQGTVLRSRPLEEKLALAQKAEALLVPHFASGRLKPQVDGVFGFDELQKAFDRLSSNGSFGKIVLGW